MDMGIQMVEHGELFHRNEAGELLLNIYCGCERVCPFCYWQKDAGWSDRVVVYRDVVERLRDRIGTLPEGTKVGVCWRGSPYPEIERELELTRNCLKLLVEHGMEVSMSASSDSGLILRDMDFFTAPGAKVQVIVEMTRPHILQVFNKTGTHPAFETANALKRGGVNICATVSPVMPGLTDVERMAAALPDIPVHIAKLDIRPGTIWGDRTMAYIRENAPELLPLYEEIARTGNDPYFERLQQAHSGPGQIRTYLPFWDEIPQG